MRARGRAKRTVCAPSTLLGVSDRRDTVLLWSLVGLLSLTLLWPIGMVLRGAFEAADGSFTLAHIRDVFRDPLLVQGMGNSVQLAACTTLLATCLAVPLATVGSRCAFPGKSIFNAFVLAPLILPPFVGAIGLRQILGRMGSVNAGLVDLGVISAPIDFLGDGGFWSIVAIQGFCLYPIIYLNLVAALSNIDPALEESARGIGARAFTRWRRVTLPLVRGGLFAGAVIVFIWSFTELGTPLMFEYRAVTPVQIFDGLKEMETSRQPYALTAIMLTVAIGLYAVSKMVFGTSGGVQSTKASIRREEKPLTGWSAIGAIALFALVGGLACVPHLGVLLSSVAVHGEWYGTVLPQAWTTHHFAQALSHPLSAGAIRNSLILSLAAVVGSMAVGLLIARALVRGRGWGKPVLDGLVMLPLAVPGIVMAFGMIALSLTWPFNTTVLRPFTDILGATPNPFPFLALAYAVRRLPYVVRAAVAGLEQTPAELEEAGAMCGASRLLITRRIVLPLVAANLIAGALLAFSFSMLEVSDSILLAQRESDFPVTKAIYTLSERLGDGQAVASALGVWAMALLAATLLGASLVLGKRLGAVFRA